MRLRSLVVLITLISILISDFYKASMGKPWASLPSILQAPIQSMLRPAVWLPIIRNFHSHQEKWTVPSSSNKDNLETALRGLMTVIHQDRTRSFWDVHKVETNFLRVFVLTRAEWLDVIELTFEGNEIKVWAFSSGFLPLFIPFASVANLALFWIPFLDMGMNKKRIDKLVQAIDVQIVRH